MIERIVVTRNDYFEVSLIIMNHLLNTKQNIPINSFFSLSDALVYAEKISDQEIPIMVEDKELIYI